jgi:folate-dependent phosphoribosylglycinamide formyltransferase PurN
MRIVVLSPSLYSETACAMAARVAEAGHVPVGAMAIRTLDHKTILRKLAQWGVPAVTGYARKKILPHARGAGSSLHNPYLEPWLKGRNGTVRSLSEVAAFHGFPMATCKNQNAPDSVTRIKEWSPDLIIFAGGDILRKPLLEAPRLGILNVHLGWLPQIRGMSSPEWSLLQNVPVGITIHYIDEGIDTGPVLQRYEFPDCRRCKSLNDLRHRLVAFGVQKIGEVVNDLDRGTISATPQNDAVRDKQRYKNKDTQFFVMHRWLQARATERLSTGCPSGGRSKNSLIAADAEHG